MAHIWTIHSTLHWLIAVLGRQITPVEFHITRTKTGISMNTVEFIFFLPTNDIDGKLNLISEYIFFP